jgi:glucokinase
VKDDLQIFFAIPKSVSKSKFINNFDVDGQIQEYINRIPDILKLKVKFDFTKKLINLLPESK